MSTTVDERVVELGFNNKEFEQGVKTSSKTLDNLKKGLNFDESAKSLGNLSKATRGFSLDEMGKGVGNISSKFSALGVIGFTVIQNLTNAAIQYGKKLVRSLVDPMKQGFSEYETQMNAIQTVLANTASKGTTLSDVGEALDELNTYADKTIYNFSEMTRNIGTFTAAGVDLETSTSAIKGIANLAAVSGSNSQQASTAMYQLSQALSSGTVKLMDWNSVVNAGMGGQVFQDALTETARVSGIAIDDLIDKHGSFRETLSTGWLSSEVLLQTLSKFTGDLSAEQLKTMGYNEDQIKGIIKLGQTANDAATKVKTFSQLKETLQEALGSGWTKTWQLILGDFEEAKGFFTEVSDTLGALIGASADSRNAVLQDWKDIGGRTFLIVAVRNAFEGLMSILTPIKEAFKNIFPPITGMQLAVISANLATLAEKLILSSENADRVKRIFAGIFSVFAIVRDVVMEVVGVFLDLAGAIPATGDGVLEFLARIGDFLVKVREGTDVAGAFEKGLAKIKEVLTTISGYVERAKQAFQEWGDAIRETFSAIFDNIDTSALEGFISKFQVRFKPFETLLRGIGVVLGGLLKGASKLIPGLYKVGSAIAEFVTSLGSMIVEALGNVNFIEIFDTINAGLIGAILLAIRQFITSGSGVLDEMGGVFGGLAEMLDGVRGSLEAWQQNLKSKTLMNIAIAVGILAASLLVLTMIDSAKLTVAIGVMTAMFLELIGAQAAFSKFGAGGSMGAIGLMGMATSMLILAGAISILSKLSADDMKNALSTILTLMVGMVAVSKFMGNNSASLISGSIGMIAVAGAMLVLSFAIKKLGEIDVDTLKQGLIGVGVLLAEILVFMRLIDDKGVAKGLGLIAMAGAVLILAQVVQQLGAIDAGQLQQGLVGVGAVLAALAIFTKVSGGATGMIATAVGVTILAGAMLIFAEVIKDLGSMDPEDLAKGLLAMAGALLIIAVAVRALPKNMILQAGGLLIIAGAMVILAEALGSMGGMTWEEIGKGLATLAGALLILSIGLYAMSGTLAGSFALLLAAGALAILAPVIQALGGMPLSEIGIALLALAGVFIVLGVAGLVLTPVVPTLLALGGAMLLIGAGTALVGAGLMLFATGLLALAAGGGAAAVAIVAFVTTILGLFPVIMQTLIDTLIIFAKGIIKATPVVMEAVKTMIMGFLQVIIDTAPLILETLGILLAGLIQLIIDNIPLFVEAMVLLMLTLLQEIALKMPDFIQAGLDILIAFLSGIRDNIAEVVTVVVEIVTEFLGAVAEQLPDIIQSGVDLMIAFMDGMSDAIENNTERILTSVGNLAGAIIDGLISGLSSGAQSVIDAMVAMVKNIIAAAWDAFDAQSPSKEMVRLARTVPQGIVKGLKKYGSSAVRATKELGNEMIEGLDSVSSAVNELISDEIQMDPTIRPVLDMSGIEDGRDRMERLLGDQSLNMIPAMISTSRIAADLRRPLTDQAGNVVNEGARIEFNQNNYSPKALSRLEIYRQTNNQLKSLKGMVAS